MKNLADKISSKIGIGNNGKLRSTTRSKKKKKSSEIDKQKDEVMKERIEMRKRWYKEYGINYEEKSFNRDILIQTRKRSTD